MKNIFVKTLAILLACALLCACGTGTEKQKTIRIGILQYGSHPSLDNCYTGIEQGLAESEFAGKYTLDLQNGNFDSATCDTIAKSMVANQYDIIIAIATPAALSAYSAAANSDTKVIFCAVSDPVAVKLVKSFERGGTNTAGTSDILDLAAQVDLITALQPTVSKIGILYTTSEANSISQLAKLKEIAAARGLTIVEQGVQTAADIPQAAASLASKVDCINNFTDNNVVNNLSILLREANAADIPVYGSEVEQVKNGCVASISLDYVALGRETAAIAARVLNGENTSEMAVGQITDGEAVINTDVLAKFGFTLPKAYEKATFVITGQD